MIKCFVINLDRRKDRLKRIRKHLNSNGLYFTRFQAVNALETNSKTLTKNIAKYGPLGKISIGDMACFQSHLMLWEKIYKTEKKPVLVLEDDVEFLNTTFIDDAVEQLKFKDWNLFYLGSNTHEPLQKESNNLLRIKKGYATHAIAYHKRFYDQIINGKLF